MDIDKKLTEIKKTLPASVTLIAVSKTHPADLIKKAYDTGHRHFGENKVQEMCEKAAQLPRDIYWHLVGHLQTNKVKHVVPFVSLIHSVDSLKLLKEINKQAQKNNRVINCLLQFHIAEEETKFGLNLAEATELLNSQEFKEMNNVAICGVMGMATFTEKQEQVKKEFSTLKSIFDTLKKTHFYHSENFKEISMGMSGDYLLAMEQGSTMVRVGSSIFGSRSYNHQK
ncbi:MAG: YggS family pyridoxal phosphate-dependent enzyme [Flavobacteriales bacterium]